MGSSLSRVVRSVIMPTLLFFIVFSPAVSSAVAPTREFSASTTPSSIVGGLTEAFTVYFTNSTTSSASADIMSGRVTLPSGFALTSVPVVNLSNWEVCITGAQIAFRRHTAPTVEPGESFWLTFSASTPTVGGSYAFGVQAFGNNSCVGDGSEFTNLTPSEVSVTVRTDQTITFDPLADKIVGDPDFDLLSFATSTSGLPPTFTSQTESVCTVTDTTVHLVSAGTCTIRASQAGNDVYNAAPDVDQSFTVASGIPACLVGISSFDDFSLGSVNGQTGWSSTGPFDQAIVNNTYGFPTFGCKSLRISDAVTSGTFGNQTFSDSVANEAGETDALNGGMSGGTRQNHFEAQFDIATAKASYQAGLDLSVSPDRGDGARMSYLRFEDAADGINVFFYDVQGETNPANFVQTQVATSLPRTIPHTIKFSMDFVDGPSNDIVQIYIDGILVHTGTSWENYFRFDDESNPSLISNSRTVDSLLFREGGTAAPANAGYGFLIDNYSLTSSTTPSDTTAPEMPVHVWPENGAVMPASYLTHLDWTDVTDDSMPVTYYYQSSHSSATTTGTYGSDFTTPIYQSGALSASQIAALGTPEGTYFWHVRAVDGAGNSTPWTAPWNVIVDNTPPDVTVTIVKYINGEHATADNTDGASFPMHAIFPGGEGNYSLGTTGFNNPNAYEATTSNMPWGSDYSTYEITSVSGPVYPTGAECPVGSFRLAGYRVGNTLESAETAALSYTSVRRLDDK